MKKINLIVVLAIAFALLMVVSCITPCIAVNNSTSSISNDDVTLEGVSYIVVYALNPEGIEIASIEGMTPHCVEIYDGNTLIGYGAHDNETYNKPIAISPGAHTIKVTFSGITLQQNINVQEEKTRNITFTFDRTKIDTPSLLHRTISVAPAQEAPEVEWTKTFGGSYFDAGYSVQQTTDGGYIVAGVTHSASGNDVWLIKTDASGNKLWDKTFGGSDYGQSHSVQQTTDGGYIVAGSIVSYGGGYCDVWLIKTGAFGNKLWDKTFGGSDYGDCGYSVQQTTDDGYIVAGETCSYGDGSPDVWLIKTDAFGNKLWDRTFDRTGHDQSYSVQQTTDGGYIVAGSTLPYGPGGYEVWLIKTDASGNKLWDRTFDRSDGGRGYSVQQTTDGGYIVAGETLSYGAGGYDVWLIKTDASGNKLWDKTFGGSYWDYGSSVQQTSDGGYIITGYTDSYGAGDGDVWLIKVKGEQPPVLLVHGYYGKPEHLTEMKSWLEKDNFSVYLVNYTHGEVANGDIKKYANNLSSEIGRIKKETGAKKVDIVAHSMGGLVARYYIENNDYKNDVRTLIVLGTPNRGSELFKLRYIPFLEFFMKLFRHDFKGVGEAGKQMTPNSPFLNELGYEGRANYYTIAGTDDWWLTTLILKGDDDHLVRVVSVELDEVPNHYEYYLDHGELIKNEALYNDTIKNILLDKPITKQSYVKFKTQQTPSTIQEAPMISGKINPGEEKSHEIPISSTNELSIRLLWLEGDLNLTLTTPNGTLINPSFAVNDTNITYYSDENLTIEGYDIKTPESGIWSVNVTAVNISGEEDYTIMTFLDTNITLSLSLQKCQYDPDEPINITANLSYGSEAITNASVTAEIQKPDNTTEIITLFDDGLHNDNQTNDGIYANTYINTSLWGTYDITVTASGEINGEQFERETFATVWVEQYPDLTLNTSDISFSSETPTVGENVTINATIHNIGEADANNASILFYDGEPASGEKIGEDVINVSVNATANASVSWLTKACVQEIYVLISPYNEFLEENYTNNQAFKSITVAIANLTFDTGSPSNPYPSIFGTHNGSIKPNQTITVNKLYTYPCSGTGGHTEYARIWNSTLDINATWNGYTGDWHNISFNKSFTLVANETYNYTIRTGSYPQIHHTDELEVASGAGTITCDKFIDANGKIYINWIPAIRLEEESQGA